MIELPESKALAKEGEKLFINLKIERVKALKASHTFCWLNLPAQDLEKALTGRMVTDVISSAHYLRFIFDDGSELATAEDVLLEYKSVNEEGQKHHLLIVFDNKMCLEFKVKLYGFILYGFEDDLKNTMPYYKIAVESIDPLSDAFTYDYFIKKTGIDLNKGTVKQAIATKQNIPGLGNGVLQDILFKANLSPKRKINTLTEDEKIKLYETIISLISEMSNKGGRNNVAHYHGETGGYEVLMSKERDSCPVCKTTLSKESYLGGKVIYCPHCQK